jgi:hypothetical protein
MSSYNAVKHSYLMYDDGKIHFNAEDADRVRKSFSGGA